MRHLAATLGSRYVLLTHQRCTLGPNFAAVNGGFGAPFGGEAADCLQANALLEELFIECAVKNLLCIYTVERTEHVVNDCFYPTPII